jgi:hypothetical protein
MELMILINGNMVAAQKHNHDFHTRGKPPIW